MSVRGKLLAIVFVVALAPLVASWWSTTRIHNAALEDALRESQLQATRAAARQVDSYLLETGNDLLNTAETVRWGELTPEEVSGVLWLILGQVKEVAFAALLEGDRIAASAFARLDLDPDNPMGLATEDAARLLDHARAHPRSSDVVVAQPLALDHSNETVVPFLVRAGSGREPPRLLAVAVIAQRVCRDLQDGWGATMALLDQRSRHVCRGLEPAESVVWEQMSRGAAAFEYANLKLDGALLGFASTGSSGWTVLSEIPRDRLFATSRSIQAQAMFWIAVGILGAIGAGIVVARAIHRPLRRLSEATRRMRDGDLSCRVAVEGSDELARLAADFNAMIEEIERWHSELTRRVREKSKELEEAHELILESRKMAAMASLSAGVAHEINNPLAVVISLSQVLAGRARKQGWDERTMEMLVHVESHARRIGNIVERMMKLCREASESLSPIHPAEVVARAVQARQTQLQQANVEVLTSIEEGLPQVLGNWAHLHEAVCELIDNSIGAMTGTRRCLTLSARSLANGVIRLAISDTGHGIPRELAGQVFDPFSTAKQNWQAHGLGLATVFQIVQAHKGQIRIEDTSPSGTTIGVLLPVAKGGTLLV